MLGRPLQVDMPERARHESGCTGSGVSVYYYGCVKSVFNMYGGRITGNSFDSEDTAGAGGVWIGTGSGRFSPDAPCTRAQIAAFLYRAYTAK